MPNIFSNIASRFRLQNAVQINDLDNSYQFISGWESLLHKKGEKDYAKTFLWMALDTLYSGISNITFKPVKDYSTALSICDFIERNATLLINQFMRKGFICVSYAKKDGYRIVQDNQIKIDGNGVVLNRDCVVIYSNMYQLKRTSAMIEVKPLLDMLNTLLNTMAESNHTMGTLPIISGQSIPANPKFKEELARTMSKDFGWKNDQIKYFLSQSELKVDSIELNVKDLELRENVNDVFKKILNYFQIPVDLVIGNSTYANVEAARLYFYENTVKYYAEILLKVARNLLTASEVFLPQKTITYKIENVHGLEKTLSDACAEKSAYIDVLLKLSSAGIDVKDELEGIYKDLQRDYVEV